MLKFILSIILLKIFCSSDAFQFRLGRVFPKNRNHLQTPSSRKSDLSSVKKWEIPKGKRCDPAYKRELVMEDAMTRFAPREDLPAMFMELESWDGSYCSSEDPEDSEDSDEPDDTPLMSELEIMTTMWSFKKFERGDIVTGIVSEIDQTGAQVSFGDSASAIIPTKEGSLQPVHSLIGILEVGQTVTGEIIGTLLGEPVMSLRIDLLTAAWDIVNATRNANETFEVQVLAVNKGGAVCTAPGGLRSFLPGSQSLSMLSNSSVGSVIKVKILDTVEREGKLVVSQRLAATPVPMTTKRGSLITGKVTGIRPYGVFVEVDTGHSGLLHISQISQERLDALTMETMFEMGELITAVMVDFDRAQGRMSLSTKVLEAQSGDMVRNKNATMENAAKNLESFNRRVVDERAAREEAAKEFVASITAVLAESGSPIGSEAWKNSARLGLAETLKISAGAPEAPLTVSVATPGPAGDAPGITEAEDTPSGGTGVEVSTPVEVSDREVQEPLMTEPVEVEEGGEEVESVVEPTVGVVVERGTGEEEEGKREEPVEVVESRVVEFVTGVEEGVEERGTGVVEPAEEVVVGESGVEVVVEEERGTGEEGAVVVEAVLESVPLPVPAVETEVVVDVDEVVVEVEEGTGEESAEVNVSEAESPQTDVTHAAPITAPVVHSLAEQSGEVSDEVSATPDTHTPSITADTPSTTTTTTTNTAPIAPSTTTSTPTIITTVTTPSDEAEEPVVQLHDAVDSNTSAVNDITAVVVNIDSTTSTTTTEQLTGPEEPAPEGLASVQATSTTSTEQPDNSEADTHTAEAVAKREQVARELVASLTAVLAEQESALLGESAPAAVKIRKPRATKMATVDLSTTEDKPPKGRPGRKPRTARSAEEVATSLPATDKEGAEGVTMEVEPTKKWKRKSKEVVEVEVPPGEVESVV